jgi:hypothetical protein
MNTAQRFNRIYIGDSVIERIELNLSTAQCNVILDRAILLREGSPPNIFDPAVKYEPACLTFKGLQSIYCPEGKFYLNNTIVNFGAEALGEDLVEFSLEVTGGYDNETFMRSLVFVALDFSLSSAE